MKQINISSLFSCRQSLREWWDWSPSHGGFPSEPEEDRDAQLSPWQGPEDLHSWREPVCWSWGSWVQSSDERTYPQESQFGHHGSSGLLVSRYACTSTWWGRLEETWLCHTSQEPGSMWIMLVIQYCKYSDKNLLYSKETHWAGYPFKYNRFCNFLKLLLDTINTLWITWS